MRILSRVKALEPREKVIRLEIGESDFGFAEPIKRGALEAIQKGCSSYTEAQVCYALERKYAMMSHSVSVLILEGCL